MAYLSLLLLGLGVGFSGAMLPGPMLLFTMERVLRNNAAEATKVVLGHILIEAVMILAIITGLHSIWNRPAVLSLVCWLGSVVLIVWGALLLKNVTRYKLPQAALKTQGNFKYGALLGGIFFSAFNPTFPLWWGSIGVALLSRALLLGVTGVIVFSLGHWLADFIWFTSVAWALTRGKALFSQALYRRSIKILGLLLISFGIYFLSSLFR